MAKSIGFQSPCAVTWFALLAFLLLGDLAVADQVGEAPRYKDWRIESVTVEGLEPGLSRNLIKGLALSGQFKIYRRVRPRFFPNLLADDIRRTRLFLARHGYPESRVEIRFDPKARQERIGVCFEISPGPAVRIARLDVSGLPPDLGENLTTELKQSTGVIFNELLLSQFVNRLESALKGDGYAFAKVQPIITRIDSQQVAVELAVEPGSCYHVIGAAVTGTRADLIPLAVRTMSVRPGDRYTPEIPASAQTNLRMLNLYRQIRVMLIDAGPDSLLIKATLIDRSPRSIETGFGYWSEEFLRAQLRWEHRNLLGGGRGAELGLSYSRFLQSGQMTTWWPALFGARTRLSLRFGLVRQWEKSYEQRTKKLELSAGYRVSPWSDLRVAVAVSQVDVEIKTPEAGAFLEAGGILSILSLRWSRDHANDQLYPTQGTVTWVAAEWSPAGAISESHFVTGELFAATYLSPIRGLVTALRFDLGLATPLGTSRDLLPDRRFYAGGSRSMRGFKRRLLGPQDIENGPLGGEAKFEATIELRFAIVWRFKGALFIDAGQVWRTADSIAADELEYAAGPGLMLQTPVGPLRADWARRLTTHPTGQPESVFHIAIGHPF